MATVTIHHQSHILTVEAEEGSRLLPLLRSLGCAPEAPCGGNGSCGKCNVLLQTAEGKDPVEQLACQTLIHGDCRVFVDPAPGSGRDTITLSNKETSSPVEPEDVEQASLSGALRAAVDLGSTTIALSLFAGRKLLGTAGAWNAQAPYGADVISRVKYCMDHKDGLQELGGLIRSQVRQLICSLLEEKLPSDAESRPQLQGLCLAGNTIMQHIFAGLDPSSIARAPFTPSTLFAEDKIWYFEEFPNTQVRFLPCIAGFIGGDITAGLLDQDFSHRDKLTLFLDIGTNGEMALGDRRGLLCTSVASGPAFEGAGISCGMRSTAGAIRRLTCTDHHLQASVVDDRPACGICGSGMIDLMAFLQQEAIIDETGLLPGPEEIPDLWSGLVREDENENGIFCLSHALPSMPKQREIFFTASDVRQVQLAKAAVRSGIELLLRRSGHPAEDVEEVLIAGGLGNHLSPANMAAIGMLPQALTDKVRAVGNTSLSGASRLLLQPYLRQELIDLCGMSQYLELSLDPDFSQEFVDHMYFPRKKG